MLFQKSHLHYNFDHDNDDYHNDADDYDALRFLYFDNANKTSNLSSVPLTLIDSHHEAEVPLASDLHSSLQ